MIPKPEKCTKGTQNVPKCHKISRISVHTILQMAKNVSIFAHLRPSKICQNWDYWLESKPSGSPDRTPKVILEFSALPE
jgi:hypothetical protein